MNIDTLLKRIVILKNHTDYRIGDLVFHKGNRWKKSLNNVLNNPIYDDTILKRYLKIIGENNYNLHTLYTICNEFKNVYVTPDDFTLVIHVRAGDVCVLPWFMKKQYVYLIEQYLKQSGNSINKVVFVITYSYCEYFEKNLWLYTEEKQNKNVNTFKTILETCINTYPNINFDVYSNKHIDTDLIYCVYAKYFVPDEGGFSNIIMRLREINQNINKHN